MGKNSPKLDQQIRKGKVGNRKSTLPRALQSRSSTEEGSVATCVETSV